MIRPRRPATYSWHAQVRRRIWRVLGMLALAGLAVGCSSKEELAEARRRPEKSEPRQPTATAAEQAKSAEAAPEGAQMRGSEVDRAEDGPESAVAPPTLVSRQRRYVKVFYGTNRLRSRVCKELPSTRWNSDAECKPNSFFENYPAAPDFEGENEHGLEVGTVKVTFPPDHVTGQIERPMSLFTFELRPESPDEHVLIAELWSFSADYNAWVDELRSTRRDQAFIYVHGFSTTFDEAARRAAQVAYDLDFDLDPDFEGLVMFYSWPSRGRRTKGAYNADSNKALEAAGAFNQFLDLVKKRAGIQRVHVIAHSMGNVLVAQAIEKRQEISEQVVDQLILAAPDLTVTWFEQLKRRLPRFAERVTLYLSDTDRALAASEKFHDDDPRIGKGLLQFDGSVERLDPIDASGVSSDFMGHSYYAQNSSVLSDLYCLLKGLPPESRPMIEPAGLAWRFRSLDQLSSLDSPDCVSPMSPSRIGLWQRWGRPVVGVTILLTLLVLMALRARRWPRRGSAPG